MPELPEVETIKNDLAPVVAGHHFVGVNCLCPQMVRRPTPDELQQRLIGQTI
jgi:formamidopyrimidine-DNA glycosylase